MSIGNIDLSSNILYDKRETPIRVTQIMVSLGYQMTYTSQSGWSSRCYYWDYKSSTVPFNVCTLYNAYDYT